MKDGTTIMAFKIHKYHGTKKLNKDIARIGAIYATTIGHLTHQIPARHNAYTQSTNQPTNQSENLHARFSGSTELEQGETTGEKTTQHTLHNKAPSRKQTSISNEVTMW